MVWVVVISVFILVMCILAPLQLAYAYSTVEVSKNVHCRSLGDDVLRNRRSGKEVGLARVMYNGEPRLFTYDMKDSDRVIGQHIIVVDVLHFNCPKFLTPCMEMEEFWFDYSKEKLNKKLRKVTRNSFFAYIVLQAGLIWIYLDMIGAL